MQGDGVDDMTGMHRDDGVENSERDHTGAGSSTGKYVLYLLGFPVVLSVVLVMI